jgi:aminoglycoside phosphotransferase (APT) family kinase protein
MANSWDADHEIGDDDAVGLIDSQFPSLAPARLAHLGAGWDNVAFVVNDAYVFRFPRRQMGCDLMQIETRWLPLLAAAVPVRIPAPEFVGAPEGDYPYPFAGYPMIPGETACRAALPPGDRAALARPLGGFLRALHAIPLGGDTRTSAPGDTIRRADIAHRVPGVRRHIGAAAIDAGIDPDAAVAFVDTLADAAPAERTCWVHGDLYARHLLVDRGALSGVIDWGDMHVGDPALDLSIAYSFLPARSRPAFFDAYGPVDAETRRRARFRALHFAGVLLPYGRDQNDDAIVQLARDAVTLAMDD